MNDKVMIQIDDRLLLSSLAHLLNTVGIKIDEVLFDRKEYGRIDVYRDKALFSEMPSRETLPLSNWKEVRRRIEELVKPPKLEMDLGCGVVEIQEDYAVFVRKGVEFGVTKQDLQTILEKMK